MKSRIALGLLILMLFSIGNFKLALAQNGQPNIILINLDDADARMLSQDMLDLYYPAIRDLAEGAIRFTNAHATTPFCAPSRAALMRGQYAFNTGIKVNQPSLFTANGFAGSYTEFLARNYPNDCLGVWMKNAGYRTIHIGKYHHANFDYQVAPGWDDFVVNLGARYYSTSRFTNRDAPKGRRYNTGPDNYVVDVDAADAVYFLNEHLANRPNSPFFLYLAPLVPHRPVSSVPVTGMVKHEYADYPVPPFPMPPNFDEADMSDKPFHLQSVPQFTTNQIDNLIIEFESRARAMKSIDDMIATVTAALPQEVLDNTWIFLTSDNGYLLGEHRLQAKINPYDASTRVPLIVKGPGTSTTQANHLLAHIDICPTILELAGATIPATVDAKSFRPLLEDPQAFSESDWQTEIMIENWTTTITNGVYTDFVYTGLRMYDSVFVNWANGENEFYDLISDPFQLDNSFLFLGPEVQDDLTLRLGTFRTQFMDPNTTITSPGLAPMLPREFDLEGFSEDDRGIDEVLTTIQSSTTGRYWNGSTWQNELVEFVFDPLAPSQLVTQWRQPQLINTDTPDGLDALIVNARSQDVDGQIAQVPFSTTILIDSRDPFANYAAGLVDGTEFVSGEVNLSGFYRDNFNVMRVDVVIIDLVTSEYWNGTTFQPDWTAVQAELIPSSSGDFEVYDPPVTALPLPWPQGTWLIEPKLPAGIFACQIQPFDDAGNAPEPRSLFFQVTK